MNLVAKDPLTDGAEIQIGDGHFFTDSYIECSAGRVPQNGGARDADWFYVQTSFTFSS